MAATGLSPVCYNHLEKKADFKCFDCKLGKLISYLIRFWTTWKCICTQPCLSWLVCFVFPGSTYGVLLAHLCQKLKHVISKERYWCNLMRRSIRKFNIPPPGNPPGIWTFEDCLVQIPSPRGKKAVQMPHQLVLNYLSSKSNLSKIVNCKIVNQHCSHFSKRDMP